MTNDNRTGLYIRASPSKVCKWLSDVNFIIKLQCSVTPESISGQGISISRDRSVN
jgi:hypothetical protein